MQFRLAPAYALYLVLRSSLSSPSEPDLSTSLRDKHASLLASKMVQYLQQIIEVRRSACLEYSYILAPLNDYFCYLLTNVFICRLVIPVCFIMF